MLSLDELIDDSDGGGYDEDDDSKDWVQLTEGGSSKLLMMRFHYFKLWSKLSGDTSGKIRQSKYLVGSRVKLSTTFLMTVMSR